MKSLSILFALLTFSVSAFAQVSVKDPWVRATVHHQTATGVFMQITSTENAKLISGTSPVGKVEIHEMRLENDVMRMRQIDALALPAGQQVELKPGGYHLMFTGLKQALKEGDMVELTLTVEIANKEHKTIAVTAPVRALTTGHGGKKHTGHH